MEYVCPRWVRELRPVYRCYSSIRRDRVSAISVLLRLTSLLSLKKRFEAQGNWKRLPTVHCHCVVRSLVRPRPRRSVALQPRNHGHRHPSAITWSSACDLDDTGASSNVCHMRPQAQRRSSQVRPLNPQVGTSTLPPPHRANIKVRWSTTRTGTARVLFCNRAKAVSCSKCVNAKRDSLLMTIHLLNRMRSISSFLADSHATLALSSCPTGESSRP